MDEKGLSVADALALSKSNTGSTDCFGNNGNGAWWIIIIVLLFAFGGFGGRGYGYGCGGNGNMPGECNTNTVIIPQTPNGWSACCAPVTQQGLTSAFNFNQLDNGQRSLERGLCDGFYTTNLAITNMGTNMQRGFCEADRANLYGFNNIQNAVSQSTNALQNTMNQGFNSIGTIANSNANAIQSTLAQTNFNIKDCCCQMDKAIMQSNFNNQTNFNNLTNQIATSTCSLSRGQENLKYEIAQATCNINANNDKNTDRIINHLVQNEMDKLRTDLQSAQFQLSQAAQTNNIISKLAPVPIPSYSVPSPYVSLNNNGYGCNCM